MNEKRKKQRPLNRQEAKSSPYGETKELGTHELMREQLTEKIPIKPCLKIIGLEGGSQVVYLGEEEVVIGRSKGCDIQLPVGTVSARHARVVFRNEGFVLEDLGSKNGTYVNGVKMMKSTLQNNDQLSIGGVTMAFVEEMVFPEK